MATLPPPLDQPPPPAEQEPEKPEQSGLYCVLATCFLTALLVTAFAKQLPRDLNLLAVFLVTFGVIFAVFAGKSYDEVPDKFTHGIDFLSDPIRKRDSGYGFTWWLFESSVPITNEPVVAELPIAGVLTQPGKKKVWDINDQGKPIRKWDLIEQAFVGLKSTFSARIATENKKDVLQFMRYAPEALRYAAAHPEELAPPEQWLDPKVPQTKFERAIIDLVGNRVLSVARVDAGLRNYEVLTNERLLIGEEITEHLSEHLEGTVYDRIGLSSEAEYEITHVIPPKELEEAVNRAAAAKKDRQTTITNALAAAAKRAIDADGEAQEISKLTAAWGLPKGEERTVAVLQAMKTAAASANLTSVNGIDGLFEHFAKVANVLVGKFPRVLAP